MNISLLSDITNRIASHSDTPALDASVLIAHIIDKPRTWVMAHPEFKLTTGQQKQLDDSLARLERGESFPYVLGHWEFFGMEFDITPDVLIPRPETELLVERAIAWLDESPVRRTVADVGTGSGAIAVAIAVNMPEAHVLATDISHKALEVARTNASKFAVLHQIDFVQCDVLPGHMASLATERHFDLICANLPYIPTEALHALPVYQDAKARCSVGPTQRFCRSAVQSVLVDIGQRFLEVVRREVPAPGFAAAVDTRNPEEGITDRAVPRGCRVVLSSLFDEVDE